MSRLPSPTRKFCGCRYGLRELKLYESGEEPRVISPVRRPMLSPRKYNHKNQSLPSWWNYETNKSPTRTSGPRRLYID